MVVWPGVDHDFYTPARQARQYDVSRVCYVGRVELAKGIGYLLPAGEQLRLSRAELLLVGEIHPEVRLLLARYASASVKTAGMLTPEEVAARYRESDVFVLPSVNEGLALVLLEATASGLPVVASDTTGTADCITPGREGLVVPPKDADALAEAILWCHQHSDDAKAMGNAARIRVEQEFMFSHYEKRTVALYGSLAGIR